MNKTLIIATVLVASSAAFATPSSKNLTRSSIANGFYIGAGINHNAVINNDLENRRWGYGLFLGQRVNHWLAHELSFARIGNIAVSPHWEYANIYHTSYSAYGFLPLVNQFELFGKVGMSYLSMDYERHPGSMKYSRLALNYGVGIQYTYQNLGVRAVYTHINVNDDTNMPSSVRDVAGLDAFYRLG